MCGIAVAASPPAARRFGRRRASLAGRNAPSGARTRVGYATEASRDAIRRDEARTPRQPADRPERSPRRAPPSCSSTSATTRRATLAPRTTTLTQRALVFGIHNGIILNDDAPAQKAFSAARAASRDDRRSEAIFALSGAFEERATGARGATAPWRPPDGRARRRNDLRGAPAFGRPLARQGNTSSSSPPRRPPSEVVEQYAGVLFASTTLGDGRSSLSEAGASSTRSGSVPDHSYRDPIVLPSVARAQRWLLHASRASRCSPPPSTADGSKTQRDVENWRAAPSARLTRPQWAVPDEENRCPSTCLLKHYGAPIPVTTCEDQWTRRGVGPRQYMRDFATGSRDTGEYVDKPGALSGRHVRPPRRRWVGEPVTDGPFARRRT